MPLSLSQYNLVAQGWYQHWLQQGDGPAANPADFNLGQRRRSSFSLTGSPGKGARQAAAALHAPVPPVDNRPLLKPNSLAILREGLKAGEDYVLLPPLAWGALVAWYDGGPAVSRPVEVSPEGEVRAELYPLVAAVGLCDEDGKGKMLQREVLISRREKVGDFIKRMCEHVKSDPDRSR